MRACNERVNDVRPPSGPEGSAARELYVHGREFGVGKERDHQISGGPAGFRCYRDPLACAGAARGLGAWSRHPCRLRGAADIIEVCQHRIHHDPFHLSKDGNFSWEEVECLGACVNAPMVLIWKDTYEDLTKESFGKVLDGFASGNPPKPGPQIDRQLSAPVGGPTTLKEVT